MLRALVSASCDIIHETGGTICYGHWVLRLVISHAEKGVDLLRALGSASCDFTHKTGGTICSEHWVLRFVISHTRQGVRVVPGIGFCLLRSHTRDKRYGLLRALGSASGDISHETRGTICCEHWSLHPVISHTKQGIRFVTGIGFCFL